MMEKEKQKKSKKSLIALLLVAILGVVGGTFAYFTSTDTFPNIFRTKAYKMEVVETFKSPDDWTPGTTTDQTVVATNKGDVEAAVRISYTESWEDSEGNTLALKDTSDNVAAIINFANDLNTKWTKSTENGVDYYYYKTKLAKNASTSSLINSVTFNPDVAITTDSNCVDDDVNHTKTCTSTTGGYAGGTYTLTIKVETIQFDQYKDVWSTNVEIS